MFYNMLYDTLKKLQKLQETAVNAGISYSADYRIGDEVSSSTIKVAVDYVTTIGDVTDRRRFTCTFSEDDPASINDKKISTLSNTIEQIITSKNLFTDIAETEE